MIKTEPQTRPVIMSIVANVGYETVQLVTNCLPDEGQGWLDFFSLPKLVDMQLVSAGFDFSKVTPDDLDDLFDIHYSWGVAWYDNNGVMHTAGSDLIYAERAKRNLEIHGGVLPDGMVSITDLSSPHDAERRPEATLFIAEAPDDEQEIRPIVAHTLSLSELLPALELLGIQPTDGSWAYGVTTPEGVDVIISYDHDRAVGVLSVLRNWAS